MVSEVRHHAGALGSFSDAFERLVFLQAAQFGKAVLLRLVVQNIAAEDLDQFGFRDERGKRKEHEPAFRAITAPMTPARRARLPKSRIAAAEYSKIRGMIRKTPGNLDLRQRPQQRKIGNARANPISEIFRKHLLEFQGFAELMIDLDAADFQIWL